MAAEIEAVVVPSVSDSSPPCSDPRVRCRSRRWAAEVIGHCGPFVGKLGDGQTVEAEGLAQALSEALWNFETALHENITVNGQPWQETSDDLQNDTDIKLLEDQLDELIVEVASKRNRYPRNTQVHVVKAIKEQRELLDCYKPIVSLQEIKAEPSQDSHMADLKLSAKNVSRNINESLKSLLTLVEKAEGFSKTLSLQPALELCKLRQEISSGSEVKKENKTEVKNLMSQVEVSLPETAASHSVLLKIKRRSCSPQENYPLRQRKIVLDT